MTVSDLAPIELYSLVVTAFVMCGLGIVGAREWSALNTHRERFIWCVGMVAVFGAPVIVALRVIALGR